MSSPLRSSRGPSGVSSCTASRSVAKNASSSRTSASVASPPTTGVEPVSDGVVAVVVPADGCSNASALLEPAFALARSKSSWMSIACVDASCDVTSVSVGALAPDDDANDGVGDGDGAAFDAGGAGEVDGDGAYESP